MKTQKTNNKKKSQEGNPFPQMAEMMKTFCPSEGDTINCCSMIRRMMDQHKGAETKETHEPPKDGDNG